MKVFSKIFYCGLVLSLITFLNAETWQFASEESKKDVQDIYTQTFVNAIKKTSKGKIKVKIYYYGQ